jgi:hypothetical protein
MLNDKNLSDEDRIALAYYVHIEFNICRDITPIHVEELITVLHGGVEEWRAFRKIMPELTG